MRNGTDLPEEWGRQTGTDDPWKAQTDGKASEAATEAAPAPEAKRQDRQKALLYIIIALLGALLVVGVILIIVLVSGHKKDDVPVLESDVVETAPLEEVIPAVTSNEEAPETTATEPLPTEPAFDPATVSPTYTFVSGKYTWEEAEAACEAQGGTLAAVHSDEQWKALPDAVDAAKKEHPELRYVWLGATSEVDDDLNLTFHWADDSETYYIITHPEHWYYDSKLGIREPSGYDGTEYQKSGTLVREPYLLLWKAKADADWTLNDVPDLTGYDTYKDSNMGYILQTYPEDR